MALDRCSTVDFWVFRFLFLRAKYRSLSQQGELLSLLSGFNFEAELEYPIGVEIDTLVHAWICNHYSKDPQTMVLTILFRSWGMLNRFLRL